MSRRPTDALARLAVAPHLSSLFNASIRTALEAMACAEASAINRGKSGRGVPAQAFGLRQKVFEIDRYSRSPLKQLDSSATQHLTRPT
jgi:predicted RNase H-like nuclease